MTEKGKPGLLKLLGIIVDRANTKKVVEILREEEVQFHFITLAEGTAGTDIMALLGLESTDKAFICCIEPGCRMPALLSKLSERLQLKKPGKGIAFTIPLNGINNAAHQLLTKNIDMPMEEGKMNNAKNPVSKNDLIIAVVNQGYVEQLMEAAKAAGARGGTVLHGRSIGVGEEDVKFFGITIQHERDIVTILTTHEQKAEIMRAVTQVAGMNTEARGLILSLPVDDIEGLSSLKTEA